MDRFEPMYPVVEYHQRMIDGIKRQDPDEVCEGLRLDFAEGEKMITMLFEYRLEEGFVSRPAFA